MPEDKDLKDDQTDQPSHEDLQAVEDLMGPAPDFPMAAVDLEQAEAAKAEAAKKAKAKTTHVTGHGFRKKTSASTEEKKSKIAVTFGDEEPKATAKKIAIASDDAEKTDANKAQSAKKAKSISITDADAPEDSKKDASSMSLEVPKKGIVVKDFTDTEAENSATASGESAPEAVTAKTTASAKNDTKLQIKIVDSTASPVVDEDDAPTAPPLPLEKIATSSAKPKTPRPASPAATLGDIKPGTPIAPRTTPPPPNPRAALTPAPSAQSVTPAPVVQAAQPQQAIQSAQPIRPRPVDGVAVAQVAPKPQIPRQPPPVQRTTTSSAAMPRPANTIPPSQIRPPAPSPVAQPAVAKPKTKRSLWHIFKIPAVRWSLIAAILAGLIAVSLIPASRYALLNIAGVRVSASLLVKDDKTTLPLKNVVVSIANTEVKTDEEGRASLSGLKLGKNELAIKKIGFETVSRSVTLGWGSNPLGDFGINAVGAQYTFVVKDWLSQKPIAKAEVSSGDASAYTDDNGVALLTTDKEIEGELKVGIAATGYRPEEQKIDAQDKSERQQVLVPNRQHYFISKRSGKFDVYKIDVDGKNESMVIAGTGVETDDIKLIPHPSKPMAALVASRENSRNKDGFLLSGLYMIDFETSEIEKIGLSERVEIIAWQGDYLVYAKIAEGASNTNPQRHRLMSYDSAAGTEKELAASNYFNDILAVGTNIYYAPSNAFQENPNAQLYRVKADGSEQISIVNKEVWNMFRLSYDSVDVLQHQDWYTFKIGETLATKKPNGPANPKHRIYVDSPDGKRSVWIDERDGQGVILIYDLEKKQDTILYAKTGLTYPIRWLTDDYLVFRVSTGSEIADYVMCAAGKEPIKIRDVSNSAYIGRWYYY